jgi:arylsulfatase A-like enzyme
MGIHHVFFPDSWTGLPVEEITIADKLKEQGYATGIVGKWHLGHHQRFLPLQRGFDEYFGIPYSNDMSGVVYLRGNDWVDDEVDQSEMVKTYTKEALDFIDRHRNGPFFLYMPHNMPHVPIYASEKFLGTSPYGLYGDVVQEIDWSVGQLVEKLQALGIEENTIIVFSSDNGPWLRMIELGGSAGVLREGKGTTFEGGVRVPTVIQWKSRIKPGRMYEGPATMMDWFPTFVHACGGVLPDDRPIDGEDLMPVLLGTGDRKGEDYAYWFLSRLQAYRSGDWKIKLPHEGVSGRYTYPGEPPHDTLLFNLRDDPGERNNLYAVYPEKVRELAHKLEAHKADIGPLPRRLKNRIPGDNSHGAYLREKYGNSQ